MNRLILVALLAMPSFVFAQQPTPAAAAAASYPSHERRALTANVAEYTFTVRVGDGPFDEIALHRVTRETSPGVPSHARKAVFLAPGDIWDFRAAFLTGARPLPVFLAENGIDVWGIDYRWTRVPGSTADTSFMASWGLEQDASDLAFALGVARHARAMTGGGFDKLFLLGWSRGGQIGYALLNAETQLPPGLRNVAGFIPVDIYLKTDVPELKAFACQRQQNTEAAIAMGEHANPVGGLVALLGTLAIDDPNGPSILGPFSNRVGGLLVGQATFALQGGLEFAPFYHFTGGVFDVDGNPAGLLYSNESDLFAFEAAAATFQPNRELADGDAVVCEAADVAFDDHLGAITVPVFYIGAGGGFGDYGIYTTTLLGSTDVTSLVISKVPSTQRLFDYGHADLFLANDAEELVWEPMLEWISAR
ncbi:MAG TPA: hypothetical protein VEU30_13500 [Thermoanaerobaculia bacterium]|nr:hypothetical protein [Thermoanaerobaculia bacterium]